MPIVSTCTAPGCETLTIGLWCVEHDAPVERAFVRGRPFVRKPALDLRPVTVTMAPPMRRLRRASERPAAVPLHR
jgi:hypothetical protein